MAQPPRRVNSESRRRTMESPTNSNSVMNGVASVKPKTRHSNDVGNSPYSQSRAGIGEVVRRISPKEKPAIPAKPPLGKMLPPKCSKSSTATTTAITSKTQTQVMSGRKLDSDIRVNGSEVKKTVDVNGEARPSSGKGRLCLEITLEKKISTPTITRKNADREIGNSTPSSSEESSPSQSPSKSVHFKSSRSSSASSTDSRDRTRLFTMQGGVPRYQSHTISSADKIQGRARSAVSRTGSGTEAGVDTQLNGSSSGTSVEPMRRARARSVGPIRRVRSNEMMRPVADLSPSAKCGTVSSTQVRSRSVERTKNRQSFGGFVQRQRQAWEERVTVVTKRPPLGNVSEKANNRRSLDPNYAPKIMQQSVTVTQRKSMLFGKGASVQKVKSKLDENQVSKPTSPTSLHSKPDPSPQVPKTKSSSSDAESRASAKAEVNGRGGNRGNAQGDNVISSEQNRTPEENLLDKPSVLQEIVPLPSSKPNAPNSLPVKPVYQNADTNHRISPAKENKIDSVVTNINSSAGNGLDETDNGKIHLFIDEDELLGGRPKAPSSESELKSREGYSEFLGLTDPKEINKLNSETMQSLKNVDNNILDKSDELRDKAKEKEKAGISNGEDMGEKDGHYFLRVVNEEQSRIEALCRLVERDLEGDMPEEVSGICRAALGKANLLTSKKFKQFRGLCEQNITPSAGAGKSTLASDLAGFWDMVMIQVDDINSKFADIQTMRENNWKVSAPPPVTKTAPRKTPAKRAYGRQVSRDKDEKDGKDSNKNEAKESRAAKMRAAREEARKRLIAAKKQAARQRILSNSSETEVEIFTASGQQQ
ncbi:uncharacterized protein [Diadema antillarum]|uniref:uncharacterized protein n=1 Tax=Diadema antillarum TaxID=105358 RepID=UPI003A854B5D